MAVFAEPTAAAEKALLIQKRLAEFNAKRPDLDDINVRIGLHMGQTVIENKIQTDLFGRHVNKASRIEGLASGGHIYLSYPVYDSIKGWLMDLPDAKSRLHGSYFLKGIDKAEEIYEIWNDGETTPEAPKTARRKSAVTKPLIAAIAACALFVLGAGYLLAVRVEAGSDRQTDATEASLDSGTPDGSVADQTADSAGPAPDKAENAATRETAEARTETTSNKTEPVATPAAEEKAPDVFFLGMIAREPILDFDTPLAVTIENEAQGLKKSVNDIAPGRHIIHYVVSYMVRYYAVFDVKPGKNVVQIAFKGSYLPSADIHYNLNADNAERKTREQKGLYVLYDRKTKQPIEYAARIRADVEGKKGEDGMVTFAVSYAVTLNDKEIAKDGFTVTSDPANAEWTRVPEKVIYSEGDHYYFVRYEHVGETIQVSVGSAFKD